MYLFISFKELCGYLSPLKLGTEWQYWMLIAACQKMREGRKSNICKMLWKRVGVLVFFSYFSFSKSVVFFLVNFHPPPPSKILCALPAFYSWISLPASAWEMHCSTKMCMRHPTEWGLQKKDSPKATCSPNLCWGSGCPPWVWAFLCSQRFKQVSGHILKILSLFSSRVALCQTWGVGMDTGTDRVHLSDI